LQSAPGALVAGSWVTYPGSVLVGSNPNTSSTGATTKFANGAVVIPWVRMLLTEGSFVGTVNGVLYGYKTGYGGVNGTPGSVTNVTIAGTANEISVSGTCSSTTLIN